MRVFLNVRRRGDLNPHLLCWQQILDYKSIPVPLRHASVTGETGAGFEPACTSMQGTRLTNLATRSLDKDPPSRSFERYALTSYRGCTTMALLQVFAVTLAHHFEWAFSFYSRFFVYVQK